MDQIQIDRIGASIAAANCEHKLLNTQYELEAAKQREMELLAVIEFMRNGLDEYWAKNNPIPEPSQTLREHEAKVLEEAVTECEEWADATGILPDRNAAMEQRFAYMNAASALRRMAEERRKK